jgi:hypothetical protein
LTADRSRNKKIEILDGLFRLPVLDRMANICGEGPFERARAKYDFFLSKLEDPKNREQLKRLKAEDRKDDELFRELKNEGHHFTRELLNLFEMTFDTTHPIRRAVLF